MVKPFWSLWLVVLLTFFIQVSMHQPKAADSFIVFTYPSFSAQWGPGPQIEEQFEKICDCDLVFRSMEPRLFLQRLQLARDVDVILGFDQFLLDEAYRNFYWKSVSAKQKLRFPVYENKFVPIDWGPLSVVSRSSKMVSLDELAQPSWLNGFALQDPRSSNVGLQFLFTWLNHFDPSKLTNFISQAHSVSDSWSTAYGLFQQKHASSVYSFFSSPIYHQVEEKDFSVFANSIGPLPIMVEYAAIPQISKNEKLSRKFIDFLLNEDAQKILMRKNYMFPNNSEIEWDAPFKRLKPADLLPLKVPSLEEIREVIEIWKKSLSS